MSVCVCVCVCVCSAPLCYLLKFCERRISRDLRNIIIPNTPITTTIVLF